MLKSVFYRVMNWIGYTLILSFLPIIISFMLEAIFKYDFALSNLANLYIAILPLACSPLSFAGTVVKSRIPSVTLSSMS